ALNRHQEALESYDRAVAIDPQNAQGHYNRANALRYLGRPEPALESYRRALEIDPGLVDDHYNLAGILHELKRFDEALHSYERAFEINPDYPWLQGMILHARMRICDWEGLENRLQALARAIEAGKPATAPFVTIAHSDSLPLQRQAAQTWVRETCPTKSD